MKLRLAIALPFSGILKRSFTGVNDYNVLLSVLHFLKGDDDLSKKIEQFKARSNHASWSLDSGAFSVLNSGVKVDLIQYIEICRYLLEIDETLEEVFSLDVIDDHKQSLKNVESMWNAGVPAIPTYHIGEPEKVLLDYCEEYPKVALGGIAVRKAKSIRLDFIKYCMKLVWPKPIHLFGVVNKNVLLNVPIHSCDSWSWQLGPSGYGRWKSLGNNKANCNKNFRAEVEFYQKLEREVTGKWKNIMEEEGIDEFVMPRKVR